MHLSVIIPTLNRPAFVAEAVKSIFDGRYQRFEIIVVDQTSDASTRDALADYLSDARFRYILAAQPGASAARNLGIVASTGNVIVFTDDDVAAQPDWLELIAAEFSADPDLQFICGSLTAPAYNSDLGFVPEFRPAHGITAWQLPLVASNANISMRRRLFDQIGGYDELCGPGGLLKSSDDGDIALRMMRSGAKWKVCPEIEVVHVHGFRASESARRLMDDYDYGNGAIYGRALRRGDLLAGAWFVVRELKLIAKSMLGGWRANRSSTAGMLRMRGFWHGLRLPPRKGFISASELQQRKDRHTLNPRDSHWAIMLAFSLEIVLAAMAF